MKQLTLIAALAALCAAQTPTAEQILDRYTEAVGGAELLSKIGSESGELEMTIPGADFKIRMEMHTSRGGRHLSRMSMPIGVEQEGLNDGVAWELSSQSGPRILEGKEKLKVVRQAILFRHELWREAKYTKAELVGEEEVEGKPAWKIVMHPQDGEPETKWFDKSTGYLIKIIDPNASSNDAAMFLLDYQDTNGVKAPRRVAMEIQGRRIETTMKKLVYGPELPAKTFDPPGPVKALLKARAGAETLPNARTIIDKYQEAIGGELALSRVKTLSNKGTINLPALGISGKLDQYHSEKGESYLVMELPGAGKVEEGNNGDVAWQNTTMQGPQVKAVADQPGALLQPSPLSPNFLAPFEQMKTVGVDVAGESPCWKIELKPRGGKEPHFHCYDQSTGLLATMVMPRGAQEGGGTITIRLSDYRAVGDVKTAFRTETVVGGQTLVIALESVELNKEVPAKLFELPEEIKTLAEQRRGQKKK